MYQHQLNIIRGVWQRLESWKNSSESAPTTLTTASSDKLRILGETLLDILLYTVYEIGPVPSVSVASLLYIFTTTQCDLCKIFNVCFFRYQHRYMKVLPRAYVKNYSIQSL